jgi:hypothetical protein
MATRARKVTAQIRITAADQATSDAIRIVLEELLPGVRLQRGRVGSNPKYSADPKVLAYGDLELRIPGEVLERVRGEGFGFERRPARRRRTG